MDQKLKAACDHHAAGRLDDAITVFEEIIIAEPDNVEAQAYMAGALADQGRFTAAVSAYHRAISLAPDFAPLHTALGVAQKNASDLEAALESYLRAQTLDRNDPAPPYNRALLLQELGRMEEAMDAYADAIRAAPELVEAHVNLGNLFQLADRCDEAVASYRRALALMPDHAETWSSLGVALDSLGENKEALACYHHAIDLDPSHAAAHYNLGIALKEQGRLSEAISSYRQALKSDPMQADALYNLGRTQQVEGDLADAEISYRAALAQNPALSEARTNLGTVLVSQGKLDAAIDTYSTGTDQSNTAWNLAVASLLAGDFNDGWKWYESRFDKSGAAPRHFIEPRWTLDAPKNVTVLVHAEQGLGDTLHIARYVHMVVTRANRVIFEVQPHLRRLLDGHGGAEIISVGDEFPDFDYQVPILSLPGTFETTLQSLPSDIPYITAPFDAQDRWRQAIGTEKPSVGIVWRGNPDHENDRNRSLDPTQFRDLFKCEGIQFFSLQKEPAVGDWEKLADMANIVDLGSELEDFTDTAGIVANLDLVISVDTAVAHLAGAMGRPCWVLLTHIPDWRWLMDRENSPWYPTLRLFRQETPGDWSKPLEAISSSLDTAF